MRFIGTNGIVAKSSAERFSADWLVLHGGCCSCCSAKGDDVWIQSDDSCVSASNDECVVHNECAVELRSNDFCFTPKDFQATEWHRDAISLTCPVVAAKLLPHRGLYINPKTIHANRNVHIYIGIYVD